MKQTIVISPTVVDALANLQPEDFKSKVLQRLPEFVYMFDKDRVLLKELSEAITNRNKKHIHPQTMYWLEIMYRLISDESRCNTIAECAKRPSMKWKDLESEKNVLREQLWKIILAENISGTAGRSLEQEGIEISTLANFISPSSRSMVRKPETISMKSGEIFDIVSWVVKYIKDADKIQMEDPYLGSRLSIGNLENILQQLQPRTFVILRGCERKMSQVEHSSRTTPLQNIRVLAERCKTYQLNLHLELVEDSALSDRGIVTDEYDINLGHSLSNVDPYTYLVKKQFKVSVVKK